RKIWDAHVVRAATPDTPAVLYIDLHLLHEVTSPQAFAELRARGVGVRRPDRTVATMDHAVPTLPRPPGASLVPDDPEAGAPVAALQRHTGQAGIVLYGIGHDRQGIVHVIAPELG